MSKPPVLTEEERREALVLAAQARKARAQFKDEIRNGAKRWSEALDSADENIRKMRIKELIEAIPGIGEIRALTILEKCGISTTRRIQGLGRKQREKLLLHMGESL